MLTRPNYRTQFFFRSDLYLPGHTRSYPAELPYPILLPIGFLLTRSYSATLLGRVTLLGTHLLTRLVTLQLASPKKFLISLPP
jgi:hypothetical protein